MADELVAELLRAGAVGPTPLASFARHRNRVTLGCGAELFGDVAEDGDVEVVGGVVLAAVALGRDDQSGAYAGVVVPVGMELRVSGEVALDVDVHCHGYSCR